MITVSNKIFTIQMKTSIIFLLSIFSVSIAVSQTTSQERDSILIDQRNGVIGIWNAQMMIGNGFNYVGIVFFDRDVISLLKSLRLSHVHQHSIMG